MSDQAQKPPSVFARLRPPAALNYLIMGGAGLLLYAFVMFGQGNDIGAILAVLLAVPGVLARWTGSPVLILLLTIYLKIDQGFINLIGVFTGAHWSYTEPGIGFYVEDVILAAGLLAYSIGHFRLLSLVHQSMPEDPTSRRDIDLKNPPRRPLRLVGPDELQKTLFVAGLCVVAAQAAWWTVVFIERAGPSKTGFSHATSRLMIVVWVGGSVLMLLSALLVYLRGNRMSPTEAAIALRDDFFQENRRETDRLQRWRKWFKERVAVRRRSGK